MPRLVSPAWFAIIALMVGACSAPPPTLTFSEDVAPIIFSKCAGCHRPSGPGPFNLTSFVEVKNKAAVIARVVQNGYMPPWPADTTYSRFVDEKILNQKEIATLVKWVEQDCPSGNLNNAPTLPKFAEGSLLGKPDMVVRMAKPFPIIGNNRDRFLLMKLPYEMERDTLIAAVEFVPHRKKLIHHVNGQWLKYDPTLSGTLKTGRTFVDTDSFPTPKEAYEALQLAQDDGTYPMMKMSVGNYLPGVVSTWYPEGIGGFRATKKGAIFLKDIHYGPSNRNLLDSSYFNIFFAKGPIKRPTLEMQLGTLGITPIEPALVIPANEVKTFKTQVTLNADISLLTINPHMHLLGKSFWAFAIKPGGDTIPLIRIRKWDFRWQYFYTFRTMQHLPAGTTIFVFGTFDNTIHNPLNPNHPPKTVSERSGSMRTSDEMFQFIMTYLPYQPGDENIRLEPPTSASPKR
jgi:hypothetical protein